MKRMMMIVSVIFYAAISAATESVSGSSDWFYVDTRKIGEWSHNIKWIYAEGLGDLYIEGINPSPGFIAMPDVPDIENKGEIGSFSYVAGFEAWHPYRHSITNVTISQGVTKIGSYAFWDHRNMKRIDIPNSIYYIDNHAFAGCSNLTSVSLSYWFRQLDSTAFVDCPKLERISVNETNHWFQSIDGVLYGPKEGYISYRHQKKDVLLRCPPARYTDGRVYDVSDSAIEIGDYSFMGCSGIGGVNIPDTVLRIGEQAFDGCTGLVHIELPSSVTTVDPYAFKDCANLKSIVLPSSLGSLSSSVFMGCSSVETIFMHADTQFDAASLPLSVSIIRWKIREDGTLVISGRGMIPAKDEYPWSGEKDAVLRVEFGEGITEIGEDAFAGFDSLNLKSVIFHGDAPRDVGGYPFKGCADDFVIKVKKGTKGWNGDYTSTELPETWLGYPIEYATEDEVLGIKTELVDGMEWKYRVVNGEAEIYGGDWTSAISETTTGAITIPSSLGGCPVTGIGARAFSDCSGLTSVTIPDSVTSFGNSAFFSCGGLTSVTIPNGVTSIGVGAFESCSGLTSITIPDSVTSIGDYAFSWCSGLTSVTIPNSVASIGVGAFQDCSGLTSITIPYSVTSIGDYAFSWCSGLTSVTIGDSVTSIGKWAFEYCDNLKSAIFLGDAPKYVGYDIFCDCADDFTIKVKKGTKGWNGDYTSTALPATWHRYPIAYATEDEVLGIMTELVDGMEWKYRVVNGEAEIYGGAKISAIPETTTGAITIPSSLGGCPVTGIGARAFSDCSGLTSVTIPDSVTSIGEGAFFDCSGLTSITIPDSVTSIGEEAFYECSGLTSVTIPDSVTSIGDRAFEYCSGLTSVTIPDSVTSIVYCAFAGCSGLTSVTIGDSVTSIGNCAFFNCSGLTSITIPDSVTSIGVGAFEYCRGLTSVTIPDSVTSIGARAFSDCSGLTSFIVDSNNPNFKSVNGLLLSKDGKTLIAGVKGNIVIPDGVTSIEARAFYYCRGLTSVTIPNSVTSIGGYAFSGCWRLTSVTIPDSVTSIGYGAFSGCSGLTSITIPDSMTSIGEGAFFDCSGLTSITIPDSVTSIGEEAFYNCDVLTIITIPNSVTSIGDEAFSGCSGLTSITIPDSVTSIGEEAFEDCNSLLFDTTTIQGVKLVDGWVVGYTASCPSVLDLTGVRGIACSAFRDCRDLTSVTIGDSVTSIGEYAFYYCSGLTSFIVDSNNPNFKSVNRLLLSKDGKTLIAGVKGNIVIPDGVTSIEARAFSGCSGLTSVTIPDSVTSIGGYAFSGCWRLTSVTIPDSVTSIGEEAFLNCSGLTSITIPDSVTSIGEFAFWSCDGLTSVTIGDSVTNIGGSAFEACSGLTKFKVDSNNPNYKSVNGLLLSKDGKTLIAGINGDVVIPDGVTSIESYAFSEYWGLTSVTIPNSVTSIGEGAFEDCYDLTSVTIPDSVTSIGDYAFLWCSGLTSVTIPNSVTSIGDWAFEYCDNLKSAIFLGDAPRNVGDYIFYDCADDFTIKVKKGTKGWNGDYTSTALPATWHGYPIEYARGDDLYPELDANATADDVVNALSSSVDENLAKNITSVEMYSAYREWALSVKNASGDEVAGVEAVKASSSAWLSFALDSDVLIAKAPVDGDVVIDSFEKDSSSGLFEFTVNIKDIGVGNDAIEENLRKVFDIEGTSNLSADFSADSVDISVVAPDNGKVKFSVAPIDKSKRSFFFRVKMK